MANGILASASTSRKALRIWRVARWNPPVAPLTSIRSTFTSFGSRSPQRARASSGESFTPPSRTYSTSTRVRRARAWSWRAATSSEIGCTFSIGISRSRLRDTACVSDTARRNLCPSAGKRRGWGTMAAVEAVTGVGAAAVTEDAGSADYLVVVEEGLAHPHVHDAPHGAIRLCPDGEHLAHDLRGLEGALEAELAGGAEGAGERAACLGRDADDVLLLLVLVRAGVRPRRFARHRDAHRLDPR